MNYSRKPVKTSIQMRFWIVLFAVLTLLLLVSLGRYTRLYDRQNSQINALRDQINQASMDQMNLKRTLAFMSSDKYIERQARREYGLMNPGDIRFMADGSRYSDVVSSWNQTEGQDLVHPFATPLP